MQWWINKCQCIFNLWNQPIQTEKLNQIAQVLDGSAMMLHLPLKAVVNGKAAHKLSRTESPFLASALAYICQRYNDCDVLKEISG